MRKLSEQPDIKTNCKPCLSGEHSQCIRDDCLCLENGHGIDAKKEEEDITYTDSALADRFKEDIKEDRELLKIIHSLKVTPHSTLNFDPTKFPFILDFFLKDSVRTQLAVRRAVLEIIQSGGADIEKFHKFKIRFTDSKPIRMNQWGAQYQNTPMQTEAIIIHMGEHQTYVKKAPARCSGCFTMTDLEIDEWTGKIQPPPKCDVEGCRSEGNRIHILPSLMEVGDCKEITIQEPMEQSQHGAPTTFKARVFDDTIRDIYIGQRQNLVGVFSVNLNRKEELQDSLIKVLSMSPIEDPELDKVQPEDIIEFKKFIMQPDFLLTLTRSVAPEIYGEQLTKLCGLIGLVGGVAEGRLRGIINTLFVGDPSTGKSKIIKSLVSLHSKSTYIDASMASGPGMTIAYDDKLKGPRIGPIVMCNGGIAGIDEITRMAKHDTPYLLQIMEDGAIKFVKAGFDIELDVHTAIIAGANPKNHHYDPLLSMVENIALIEPIISRFDLIVNLQNTSDEYITENKLNHIDDVREHGIEQYVTKSNLLSTQFLKKYLAHARTIQPRMTDEANEVKQKFYMKIRRIQQEKGSRPIDTRFYESLYRIGQAIAKLHLSEKVTKEHMEKAIEIQSDALLTFNMKVSEGETQQNMMSSTSTKETAFKHVWKQLVSVNEFENKELLLEADVIKEMPILAGDHFRTPDDAQRYFDKMDNQKVIMKKLGRYYIE